MIPSSTGQMARLDNEHHYLRLALPLMAAVLDDESCPPMGSHAMQVLESADSYFRTELVEHIHHEERVLFPQLEQRGDVAPKTIVRLTEEHAEILAFIRAYTMRLQALQEHPDNAHWSAFRHMSDRFRRALMHHLRHEEAVVFPALERESLAAPPDLLEPPERIRPA